MKKEDLLKIACNRTTSYNEMMFAFNEFYDSNICIPKGENRRQYADVLHAWVESVECEYLAKYSDNYFDLENIEMLAMARSIRIKPSEPVYEWQWIDIGNSKCAEIMNKSKHMTEDEVKIWVSNIKPIKLEETKRIRECK